ncbi:MAG: hypothetical protein WKF37_20405 [Bryobacteraceae bacterium]
MERRAYLKTMAAAFAPPMPKRRPGLDYQIQLDTIRRGFALDFPEVDASGYHQSCWVHARAGAIPGATPKVVLLMQRLMLNGNDVFYAMTEMRTDDLGHSWSEPKEHDSLGRKAEGKGIEAALTAVFPQWHRNTGKLLAAGSVIRYANNKYAGLKAPRDVGYSVYNPDARSWSPQAKLEIPGARFFNVGADSCQRFDLANGEILLPVYYVLDDPKAYPTFADPGWVPTRNIWTTVFRCAFDGKTLKYLDHGDELRVDWARGLGEPSLTRFQDRFYLTLRNDANGFVTTSRDGQHFDQIKPWVWDDGSDLGNYNTQQHWITHSEGLYLVYTRRGANNDHVFRHRAPLFMARVDPKRLCVIEAQRKFLFPDAVPGSSFGSWM